MMKIIRRYCFSCLFISLPTIAQVVVSPNIVVSPSQPVVVAPTQSTVVAPANASVTVVPADQVVVTPTTPPPAPIVEVIPVNPYPDGIWIAGYWNFIGGQYVWVRGRWARPPQRGHVWVAHQWVNHGGVWHLQSGHWQSRHRP